MVSQNVQRKTDESAADRHIRTIGRLGGDRVKLLGDTEGRSILARVEAIGIESEYRSQPVPGVVEVGLAAVAARRHTRRVAGRPTRPISSTVNVRYVAGLQKDGRLTSHDPIVKMPRRDKARRW